MNSQPCLFGIFTLFVLSIEYSPSHALYSQTDQSQPEPSTLIARDWPEPPESEIKPTDLNFNLTGSGIRLNPRYAVVFHGEGKLDNAQDYIDHHIVIPIEYKIAEPPVFPPCGAVTDDEFSLSTVHRQFCDLSSSLNASLWTTHAGFTKQMEELFGDMKLLLSPVDSTIDPTLHEGGHERRKRGILGGFACLVEALFMGCDNGGGADAEDVRRAFHKLNDRATGLASEIESVNGRLISVSKMSIEGFKNVDRKFEFVRDGMKGLSKVQGELRVGFRNLSHAVSTVANNFRQQTDLMLEALKWTTLMFEWRDQIESAYILIDAITQMERGFIPANLIPPRTLRVNLQELQRQLGKSSTRLTYPVDQLNIYYRSPMIRAVYSREDQIVVAMRIPISHQDMEFQLWSITYGQMSVGPENTGTVMQIQQGHDLIGVNYDHSQYVLLSRKQLTGCEGDRFKRCPTLFPVLPANKLTCEIALYTMQPHSVVSKECQITMHKNRDPVQSFDLGGGHWFMAAVKSDWRLFCEGRAPRLVTHCTQCVIQLPCGCGLSMPDQSIPFRRHDCRVRKFESYYSFNPFAFIKMPNIAERFHADQLFERPIPVPTIPLLQNISDYFDAELAASTSVTLNFSKFVDEVVEKGEKFTTFDRMMQKEVELSISKVQNTNSLNAWYAFGLFVGEVVLFCMMLIMYMKTCLPNWTVTGQLSRMFGWMSPGGSWGDNSRNNSLNSRSHLFAQQTSIGSEYSGNYGVRLRGPEGEYAHRAAPAPPLPPGYAHGKNSNSLQPPPPQIGFPVVHPSTLGPSNTLTAVNPTPPIFFASRNGLTPFYGIHRISSLFKRKSTEQPGNGDPQGGGSRGKSPSGKGRAPLVPESSMSSDEGSIKTTTTDISLAKQNENNEKFSKWLEQSGTLA